MTKSVMMPVQATDEMLEAVWESDCLSSNPERTVFGKRTRYAAMVSARPQWEPSHVQIEDAARAAYDAQIFATGAYDNLPDPRKIQLRMMARAVLMTLEG